MMINEDQNTEKRFDNQTPEIQETLVFSASDKHPTKQGLGGRGGSILSNIVEKFKEIKSVIKNRTPDSLEASGKQKKRLLHIAFPLAGILIVGVIIVTNTQSIMRILNSTGILNALRNVGILKTSQAGFFDALEENNLVYDFNGDGVVTGEDYSLLSEKEGALGPNSVSGFTIQSDPWDPPAEVPASSDRVDAPSVQGFGTNNFYGAATVSYPIELPAGPAKMSPPLSLSYSSSSVDDLLSGIETKYRNDSNHSYQKSAGNVALGWGLGGFGQITRDIQGTLNDPNDDKFVISFSGGSATLMKESGDAQGYHSIWRTAPNLKLKVERFAMCKERAFLGENKVVCRYQWQARSTDGTKYIFGSPAVSDWAKTYDPDKDHSWPADGPGGTSAYGGIPWSTEDWFPLYDTQDGKGIYGTRAWLYYGNDKWKYQALTYSWTLTRVESVFDASSPADVSISYKNRINPKLNKAYYASAVYPQEISWAEHKVNFFYESRLDKNTHQGDKPDPEQPLIAEERLKKINIETLGKSRKSYLFDYIYGYRTTDHPNIGSGTVVAGKAIHSLLTKITTYDSDPDQNQNAQRLPSYIFSYGQNCNGFTGGCPLSSYISKDNNTQAQTPNDFFLVSADNGFGGKVVYEYSNAINVKYCDPDKVGYFGNICKSDHAFNTQRHRVFSKTTHDGMGDTVKTAFSYTGSGSALGLAYVKEYGDIVQCGTPNITYKTPPTVANACSNTFSECYGPCSWQKTSKSCCGSGYDEYECNNDVGDACIGYYGTSRFKRACVESCNAHFEAFSDYEFLGYPEVETIVYEKNSSTDVASRSKSYFYQALDTGSCFNPHPLKGMAYKSQSFDVNDSTHYSESLQEYVVRKGPMFGPFSDLSDSNLSSLCRTDYSDKDEILSVYPKTSKSLTYIGGSKVLCTKTSSEYNSNDPFILPEKSINWGKVNCSDFSDDTSDTPRVSYTTYTDYDNVNWFKPQPKESYISDNSGTRKYSHQKIYYDGKPHGQIGSYSLPSKIEVLKDGAVEGATTTEYNVDFPWLTTKVTDPKGVSTTTVYDSTFHLYPVSVSNPLGTTSTEYDFNTTDSSHPNYQGVLGIPIKTTDVNGQTMTSVYDSFGRPVEAYLPGRKPGVEKPNSFTKYWYFNEDDIGTCNDNSHCLVGLGKQLGGNLGPKMVVFSASEIESGNPIGKLSGGYTFYNGIGQTVQSRQSWYDGGWSNAGIPIDGIGKKDVISSVEYDSLGRAVVSSLPYTTDPYIPSSIQMYDSRDFVSDSLIRKTQTFYDGYGRTVKTISPDGNVQTVEHDIGGNPFITQALSANCNDDQSGFPCGILRTTTNTFGEPILSEHVESVTGKIYQSTSENHPVIGLNTKVFDSLGNLNSYNEYNSLGQKIRTWDIDTGQPVYLGDPHEGFWEYEYDNVGNINKQTNPDGNVTEIVYDNLNRVKEKFVNGTLYEENFYDICQFGKGKLCKKISYDPNSSVKLKEISFKYNNLGQTVESSVELFSSPDSDINNVPMFTKFEYLSSGRLVSSTRLELTVGLTTIPKKTLKYYYSGPNIIKVTRQDGSDPVEKIVVDNVKYNPDGQVISYKFGNGVENSFSYDTLNGRMENLYVNGAQISSEDEIHLSYQYDRVGNITEIIDNVANLNPGTVIDHGKTLTYDSLSRLLSSSGNHESSYSYDDINNILTKSEGSISTNLTYSNADDIFYHKPQKGEINGELKTFYYDKLGNMTAVIDQVTAETEIDFEFNSLSRLTKTVNNKLSGQEINYSYDSSGQRITKIITGGNHSYFFTPSLEIAIDPGGNVSYRDYTSFMGKSVSVDIVGDMGQNITPTPPNSTTTPTPTSAISSTPAPTVPIIPGDANGDGHVTGADFIIWFNHYKDEDVDGLGSLIGNFNNDQYVNGADFIIWFNNYKKY